MDQQRFFKYLEETDTKIKDYFETSNTSRFFRPAHIYDGVFSYLLRPAKRLRPAVMLLSAGCLGGEQRSQSILPAAAAIELFHTWTLVHDDIIDNDDLRRGQQTVHVHLAELGKKDLKLQGEAAAEYGRSIAILTGDVQHGWVVSAFIETARNGTVSAETALALIDRLETSVVCDLICGEVRDVQLGAIDMEGDIPVTEEDVLEMEWLKTGALYQFAAMAGGMLGKDTDNFSDPQVQALGTFAGNCGIAFQLQDDVLGIVGDEKQLGKPIGSDIREGKKTTIVLQSLRNADPQQRRDILDTLGNREAGAEEITKVITLFRDLGGVQYTRDKEKGYITTALHALDQLPESPFRELLYAWADFMINRQL